MASETSPVPTWDAFVKSNLLSAGIVSGVCLSAQHGVPIYTHGDLDALEQADLQQFLPVFRSPSSQHTEGILEAGFTISTRGGKTMEFKVYQKTYCSVYATSPGNTEGLIISNLPHGVLLCTYRHPVQPGIAIKHVEQFCDLLRA
ncbi:uncharacterized protein LOC124140665 isoform X2 [Haliotis rufescens]|uniref:uncharacterized protein LOC124140665 isoform X2 n=1 Tax=Haliotis rufescens TaxID=6454 RepID=UPI001EAFD4CC|nr:uncharacterized protein LOC124140665 isoform X2 [Haliotis rufescens]